MGSENNTNTKSNSKTKRMNKSIGHDQRRHSIRLPGYDYTRLGSYFVTICSLEYKPIFGKVLNGEVKLNESGQIVTRCWSQLPSHFPQVELDAFIVMPNHIHGIINITKRSVGATHASPLQTEVRTRPGPKPGSLGVIVGSFKSAVTRRINKLCNTPGTPVWQRNYFEHIIRSNKALDTIRRYILNNPTHWELDRYYSMQSGLNLNAQDLRKMIKNDGLP